MTPTEKLRWLGEELIHLAGERENFGISLPNGDTVTGADILKTINELEVYRGRQDAIRKGHD